MEPSTSTPRAAGARAGESDLRVLASGDAWGGVLRTTGS